MSRVGQAVSDIKRWLGKANAADRPMAVIVYFRQATKAA